MGNSLTIGNKVKVDSGDQNTSISNIRRRNKLKNNSSSPNRPVNSSVDPTSPQTPKIRRSTRRRRRPSSETAHRNNEQPLKRPKVDIFNNSDSDSYIPTSQLSATPKIINNLTTSEYIYQTLFIDGVGSDITISALGRQWNLHTVYIKQAGYFSTLLKGNWKDSKTNRLEIKFPDENITIEAVNIALGSLYTESSVAYQITRNNASNVLATASFLQLEGLLQATSDYIVDTLDWGNMLSCLSNLKVYGTFSIASKCLKFIGNGLMSLEQLVSRKEYNQVLRGINPELMLEIVKSPNLVFCKDGSELMVYNLLRDWLYQQLHKEVYNSTNADLEEVVSFFASVQKRKDLLGESSVMKSVSDENSDVISDENSNSSKNSTKHDLNESILDLPKFSKTQTRSGKIASIFKHGIRLSQLICDETDKTSIETDCIIPKSWINSAKIKNWDKITSFRGHDTSFLPAMYDTSWKKLYDFYSVKKIHEIGPATNIFRQEDLNNPVDFLDSEKDLTELVNYLGDSTDEVILPNESINCVTRNVKHFFEERWRMGRKLPDFRENYTWHWAYYTFGLNLQYKWDILEGVSVQRIARFETSDAEINGVSCTPIRNNLDEKCIVPVMARSCVILYNSVGKVLRTISSPIVALKLENPFHRIQVHSSCLLLNLSEENLDKIEDLDAVCVQIDLHIPSLQVEYEKTSILL